MASAFQKLISQLPASAPKVIEVARELTRRGELDHAITLLRAANSRHATTTFQKLLGTLLLSQGKHDEALIPLMSVFRTEQDDTTVMLLLAECLLERGDEQRARGMLRKAEQAGVSGDRYERLRDRLREQVASGFTLVPEDAPPARLSNTLDSPLADSRHIAASSADVSVGPHTFVDGPNTWFGEDPPPLRASRAPRQQDDSEADDHVGVVSGLFVTEATDDAPAFWFGEKPPEQPDVDVEASTRAYSVEALAARARMEEMQAPSLPDAPSDAADDAGHPNVPAAPDGPGIAPDSLAELRTKLSGPGSVAPSEREKLVQEDPPSMEIMDPTDMMNLAAGPGDHNPAHFGDIDDINTLDLELDDGGRYSEAEDEETPRDGGFRFGNKQAEAPRSDDPDAVRAFRKRNTTAIRIEDLPTRPDDKTFIQPNIANERERKRQKVVGFFALLGVLGVVGAIAGVLAMDQQAVSKLKAGLDAASKQEDLDTLESKRARADALQKVIDSPAPPLELGSATQRAEALAWRAALRLEIAARFVYDEKKLESNARALARARKRAPDSPYVATGEIYLQLAKNTDAIASTARKALEQHPKHPEVVRAALLAALKANDLDLIKKASATLTADPAGKTPGGRYALSLARMHTEPSGDAQAIRAIFADTIGHAPADIAQARALIPHAPEESAKLLKPLLGGDLPPMLKLDATQAQAALAQHNGDAAGAEKYLKEALQQLKSPRTAIPLATLYTDQGRFKEANETLKPFKERKLTQAPLARVAWLQGDQQQANALIQKSAPDDTNALLLRAAIELESRKFEATRSTIRKLKKAGMADEAAVYTLLIRVMSSPADGPDVFKELDALNDKKSTALTRWAGGRARLVFLKHAPRISNASTIFKETVAALKDGVSKAPQDARMHYALCEALLRSGDGASALKHCEKAHAINPSWPRGVAVHAEALGNQKTGDAGWKHIEAAAKTNTGSMILSIALAQTALERGLYSTAERELKRWTQGVDLLTEIDLITLRGQLALRRGDPKEASMLSERASALDRNHPAVLLLAARADLTRKNAVKKAEPRLKPILDHPFWGADATAALGTMNMLLTRPAQSEQLYTQALSKTRKAGMSHAAQALIWLERASAIATITKTWNHPLIRTSVQSAERVNGPDNPDLLYQVGQMDASRRRYKQAAAKYEQALTLEPDHCLALQGLVSLGRDRKIKGNLSSWESRARNACKG